MAHAEVEALPLRDGIAVMEFEPEAWTLPTIKALLDAVELCCKDKLAASDADGEAQAEAVADANEVDELERLLSSVAELVSDALKDGEYPAVAVLSAETGCATDVLAEALGETDREMSVEGVPEPGLLLVLVVLRLLSGDGV